MISKKLSVAVLGTGNIGTDLLVKILRSPILECKLFAGRNLSSPGMTKASLLKVPISAGGIGGILDRKSDISLVFDATSAEDHMKHAKVGKMCVPAVNMKECLGSTNVNMVSCGGQASIPLAYAIMEANDKIEYLETVSSIASRSAGPATRINLDEYLSTTENGLSAFCKCSHTKAILNLNPAQPCVHMHTTVMAKAAKFDLKKTREKISEMVHVIQKYVPGYQLLLDPMIESERLIIMVRVDGYGDYLPKYAGNLDIINCAAIAFAEALANLVTKRDNRVP